MNLFEEYCKRHKLRCPLIRRPDNRLYMIFRTDPKIWLGHWLVFEISVRSESYHPAYYSFNWLIPKRGNIFHTGHPLESLSGSAARVDWDNYDMEVIKAAQRDDGITPIADLSEATMAAWEMFLFCADEQIPSLPAFLRLQICESLDVNKSIESRMQSQRDVTDYMFNQGTKLASHWQQVAAYCDPSTYACWFADLAEKMRNEEYRKEFSDMQSVA